MCVVKVLYTFDDQNKSNCLARLPNALNVPVVSLDENTQVGIIELKTCIQAIVGASPELIAKLGHDYTVYAYDFSEYETPLVGQGMLSWILASASPTPNAPAEESRSMVTGRVCKNILGLFGNGMKETLEVKLKLVPVPTSMQHEYVENMERYHSLSQLMPANFDYSAWSDFLKENPTLSQLAQPTPMMPAHPSQRSSLGGYEPFHEMLTRNSPSQEPVRIDSFYDHATMSFNTNAEPTRASSPAGSALSYQHYQYNHESRPASRTSVRSETVYPPQQYRSPQYPVEDPYVMEQREDGPPKKRARITQTKRPKKTPLTAHNDSLRVTASTAASVRLHRPLAGNAAATLASADSIPRAPTPRPGDVPFGQRRPPAPSALRHASVDESRPYMSPYDTNGFSDTAVESPDDERGESPGDTITDMPSSPPLAPQRTVSPTPSSPTLPTLPLPLPTDSGFVSDMGLGLEEDSMDFRSNIWDGSDLPVAPEARDYRPANTFQYANQEPFPRLPPSYVPRPKPDHRTSTQSIAQSIEQQPGGSQAVTHDTNAVGPADASQQRKPKQSSQGVAPSATSPTGTASHVSPASEADAANYSRSCTPNLPTQKPKTSRGKGIARSQTWSGTGEPMSDAPAPSDPAQPRSGSGARRRKYIKEKLAQSIAAGELPEHCKNCGEIDTPTWRKAFTRLEYGSHVGVEVSKDTGSTDIIALEVIEPTPENGGVMSYRIFKNSLTKEEREAKYFEELTLCNPCGLWFLKKCTMRPRKFWDKSEKPAKRKRPAASRTKSVMQEEDLASDAIVPHSDAVGPEDGVKVCANLDGTVDNSMPPPPVTMRRASTSQAHECNPTLDGQAAEDALRRAIQSSPAGLRGSRHSPIDIDPDLTPQPTRRLLFPSPRKDGEAKSLSPTSQAAAADTHEANKDNPSEKPRCERCKKLRKACDRERPCGRCDNADIGYDGCIPVPRANWFETPVVQMANVEEENPDKENCPPSASTEHDDLAHLFEDPASSKTTPQKDALFQDLLKTPTPGSRHRNPLTPRRGADDSSLQRTPTRMTPSRNILTPRGTRTVTIGPDTPFTRQLNEMLSSGHYSSDNGLDFSTFPTFNTPGRTDYTDFMTDDFMSSDMPMPSSPPKSLGVGFELYEDPSTATTTGLWSGASMFDSDALMMDFDKSGSNTRGGNEAQEMLKMSVGGVTVDFASLIGDVVGQEQEQEQGQGRGQEGEVESREGVGKTPDGPGVE